MRVVAIIQARLGSTRLPGKVLLPLAGEPMLARVMERVRRAKKIHEVAVATTTAASDDDLAAICAERQWPIYRGSEMDVLDRYVQAAHAFSADAIMRITSDCPVIDPDVLDEVVTEFLAQQPKTDYLANILPQRTFPRGLDAELIRRDVLERCHAEAADSWSREHVTAFIYQHPDRFHLAGLTAPEDYSQHRWTVDTPEDLALIEKIYDHFGHSDFSWRETLALVDAHPEWMEINHHVQQKMPSNQHS
ncbi:MAG TPA: glycosyltransferase family protein [Chthoniobacter sp.]